IRADRRRRFIGAEGKGRVDRRGHASVRRVRAGEAPRRPLAPWVGSPSLVAARLPDRTRALPLLSSWRTMLLPSAPMLASLALAPWLGVAQVPVPPDVALEWIAPPECPDRAAVLTAISRRLGRPLGADEAVIEGRVTRDGARG